MGRRGLRVRVVLALTGLISILAIATHGLEMEAGPSANPGVGADPHFPAAAAPLIGIVNRDADASWYGPQEWVSWVNALTSVLSAEGLAFAYVDGTELARGDLAGYALVIFPTNPVLTEAEVAAVTRFVAGGGRVLAFWETGAYQPDRTLRTENALAPVLSLRMYGEDSGAGRFTYIEKTPDGAALFAELPPLVATATAHPVMLTAPAGDAMVLAIWLDSDMISHSAPRDRNAAAIQAPHALYIGYNLLAAAAGSPDSDTGSDTSQVLAARRLLANAVRLALGEEARAEAERAVNQAGEALEKVTQDLNQARQRLAFIPYGKIEALLGQTRSQWEEARTSLATGNFDAAREEALAAYQLALSISPLTQEVRPVGLRGAWMGAGSLAALGGRAGVRLFLDQMQELGINTLFPEIIRRGVAAFWTEVGYRDPAFAAWTEDPLAVLVEEAHQRGIQVHPWVWVFNVGIGEETSPVLRDHPEWRELSQKGDPIAPPSGSSWLNPSLPEVREYLKNLFLEVVTRYPVDGIHLDYIRYPESTSDVVFGYSPASVAAFMARYGIDPRKIRPGSREATLWDDWRRENITSFVQEVAAAVRAKRPDLLVSAAVIPEPDRARSTTMQDWKLWLDRGFVDFVVTMAYSSNEPLLERYLSQIDAAAGNDKLVFPGLAVWVNNPEALVRQVAMARAHNAPGEVFFATDYLSTQHQEALQAAFYHRPAVSPLADPVGGAALVLADLTARIEFFYQIGALDNPGRQQWLARRDQLVDAFLASVTDQGTADRLARRFAEARPSVEVGQVDPSAFCPNRYWVQLSLQRDLGLATRLLRWAASRPFLW
ncbi:MAG: family 10 glycosylhydrolase [Limnochordales bacterium]|nr:family 10 glycosylhydrolase [Limnochordales bacterium]